MNEFRPLESRGDELKAGVTGYTANFGMFTIKLTPESAAQPWRVSGMISNLTVMRSQTTYSISTWLATKDAPAIFIHCARRDLIRSGRRSWYRSRKVGDSSTCWSLDYYIII